MVVGIIDVLSGLLIISAIVLVVVIVAAVVRMTIARPRLETEEETTQLGDAETSAREARHAVVEAHGTELIERRVDLDARRGTLGGDTSLDDAFTRLQERFERGDITEEQFEHAKIRLFGG